MNTNRTRRTAAAALTALFATGALSAPALAAPSLADSATTVSAASQTPARAAAKAPGAKKLERLLVKLSKNGAIGVTAEVRDGKQAWTTSFGKSQLKPAAPVGPADQFRAASVTKQFVAVLTLAEVEAGTFTLDSTLAEVAPGLWPANETVTVRQLLSHTSGIPDYLPLLVLDDKTIKAFQAAASKRYTDDKLVAVAAEAPATEQGAFVYSNTNYVLLGQLLEQVTGKRIDRLVDQLLDKANMRHSFYATDPKVAKRGFLHEYAQFPGATVDMGKFHPSMFSAAGALVSTTSDLNRFRRALEAGKLLDPTLVEAMKTPVTADRAYGLGSYTLPMTCDKVAVTGHDGASWGTLTMNFSAGPKKSVTIAMTGRSFKKKQAPVQTKLMLKFAAASFDSMCGSTSGKLRASDLRDLS